MVVIYGPDAPLRKMAYNAMKRVMDFVFKLLSSNLRAHPSTFFNLKIFGCAACYKRFLLFENIMMHIIFYKENFILPGP